MLARCSACLALVITFAGCANDDTAGQSVPTPPPTGPSVEVGVPGGDDGLDFVPFAADQVLKLETFGQENLVPGLVGISFTRELGPLMTGIMVAARIGAAYTAEVRGDLERLALARSTCAAQLPDMAAAFEREKRAEPWQRRLAQRWAGECGERVARR